MRCSTYRAVGLLLALAVAEAATSHARATVVYSDDFAKATANSSGTVTSGSNVYLPIGSGGGDGGAQILSGVLTLTNDKGDASNANGVMCLTTPVTGFGAPFNRVLASNGENELTWTFNMSQVRPDPGALIPGSYGAAFVLGAMGTVLTNSASGYAVVIGNPGTLDPVRLVRFSNGLQANSGVPTTLIAAAGQNAGTSRWSVKVTYRPAGDVWELFTRNDGTAFADPAAGVFESSGTTSDATWTGVGLDKLGMYWSFASTAKQTASFDNVRLDVSPAAVRNLTWDGDAAAGATADVAGNWENPGNWLEAGSGDHVSWSNPRCDNATLGGSGGSGTVTVTLGAAMTAGRVTFAGGSPVHVLEGAALTLYGSAGSGLVVNESATVRGGIAAAADQTWSVAPGKTLTIGGSGSLGLAGTLTLDGGGTVELVRTGGTAAVGAGSKVVVNAGTTLRIADGGRLTDAGSGRAADLDVRGTVHVLPVTGAAVFEGLSLSATGFLNLDGGDLLLKGTTAATARELVAAGRNGGTWDGLGGIGSTGAAGSGGLIELAVMSGAEYRGLYGTGATFHGYAVAEGDALIKYTWKGDANFDGLIDFNDFLLADEGYLFGGSGYSHGDFDGNGHVDSADYDILTNGFRLQTSILGMHGVTAGGTAVPLPASGVPEPASLLLLAGGGLLAGRQRRRMQS